MSVLVKPIITEKMTAVTESQNKYGFVVEKKASKGQIKKAVEEMYSVDVKSVNTMVYSGKKKSRSTRTAVVSGKTKAYKKAIISVAEGQMIDFYSNI